LSSSPPPPSSTSPPPHTAYTVLGIIGKSFTNIEQSLEILLKILKETGGGGGRDTETDRQTDRQTWGCVISYHMCLC
jgi:hypothetical protein